MEDRCAMRDYGCWMLDALCLCFTLFPFEHAFAGDAVPEFAGGVVQHGLAKALPPEEEEGVADFLFGVIEALAAGDFADVLGRDGDFFAAIKLQQAFVSDFL